MSSSLEDAMSRIASRGLEVVFVRDNRDRGWNCRAGIVWDSGMYIHESGKFESPAVAAWDLLARIDAQEQWAAAYFSKRE